MYACAHACVASPYSCVTVHIFDTSLNKYGCHTVDMCQTATMLHGHTDQPFTNVPKHYSNIQSTSYCHICASNNLPTTTHMCILLHADYWLHINLRSLHISVLGNATLLCCCYACVNNKYVPLMLYICHMPKLLNVHQRGKFANIHETYGINLVTRNAVNRRQ